MAASRVVGVPRPGPGRTGTRLVAWLARLLHVDVDAGERRVTARKERRGPVAEVRVEERANVGPLCGDGAGRIGRSDRDQLTDARKLPLELRHDQHEVAEAQVLDVLERRG